MEQEQEPAEEYEEKQNLSDSESIDESNIKLIQVHFEEFEGGVEQELGEKSGTTRSRYYKQTYRPAWESMPDFKGWLRGVVGEPTRAYCMYCQKTLHAHRLSLLKHTCTIRHQKAAQLHVSRKVRKHPNPSLNNLSPKIKNTTTRYQRILVGNKNVTKPVLAEVVVHEPEQQDTEMNEINNQERVDYTESEELEQEIEEEEDSTEYETITSDIKQTESTLPMDPTKPPISTHVLNTAKGTPVTGLQVSLYKLIEGRWTYINEGLTSTDGRLSNFIERADFTPGRYKLHYDVDRYFELSKQNSLYPFIEIVFDCRTPKDHYHIPLLLSPFGYTTYRGS